MDAQVKETIDGQVRDNRVMLYMKGSPNFPQCGFSGQVIQILNSYGTPYESCNVLDDMTIREGIKSYSDWPTIPQLYVDGQFVGGCDIVTEMHQSGELKGLLLPQGEAGPAATGPAS
ncbi:MAG: Grx4 family monothiol glutaredoxin [Phycisphaerae bacterium]|nr:Grx4 family monothiol glutaredoxin [Phycisphaerae bacterium]